MNVLKKGYMHQQWFKSIIRAFLFVRGHTSIKGNEKPDGLAVSGAIGEGPSRDRRGILNDNIIVQLLI